MGNQLENGEISRYAQEYYIQIHVGTLWEEGEGVGPILSQNAGMFRTFVLSANLEDSLSTYGNVISDI